MIENILFIGGAGFIGSNLIKQVDRTKYSVHIMEPEFANVSRLDGQDVVVHRSALSEIEHLTNIIKDNNIKIVVHPYHHGSIPADASCTYALQQVLFSENISYNMDNLPYHFHLLDRLVSYNFVRLIYLNSLYNIV